MVDSMSISSTLLLPSYPNHQVDYPSGACAMLNHTTTARIVNFICVVVANPLDHSGWLSTDHRVLLRGLSDSIMPVPSADFLPDGSVRGSVLRRSVPFASLF